MGRLYLDQTYTTLGGSLQVTPIHRTAPLNALIICNTPHSGVGYKVIWEIAVNTGCDARSIRLGAGAMTSTSATTVRVIAVVRGTQHVNLCAR
jgi:hypothetical protein